ncbi:MAG: FAD-dependent oxidoreductase [Solirubrobacterales bacterium]|nr:FAD-dependent oxidoreductase [Solirubrobacterales bacterium]
MAKQTFVIVGAALAGGKAAEELRQGGFDGQLILIGAEPERPYERPPLSKDYLRGESERENAYVHPGGYYGEHHIDLRTETEVTAIDPGAHTVTTSGGEEISFDKLLLATGAEPRRIPVAGADLEGIYYLRSMADCDTLRERLQSGATVAVVGAGWIGSEVAASARQKGLEVTMIDPLDVPYENILGAEIGAFYRDVHAQHGVRLLLGDGVESFQGNGRVQRLQTTGGETVQCDFAVVGIGVVPRVQLARQAGLEVDNGIVVDARLTTSSPDVFAAGDVANAWHPFFEQHIRVEHWANALNQGPAAARSMLGEEISYDRIPYFFSDQYDVGMEYSGHTPSWDEVVFRGDREGGEFIAFWLHGGRVIAGMNVNVWDVNDKVQALIRSRRTVDRAALQSQDVSLDELAGSAV